MVMNTIGLKLTFTHVNAIEARAVGNALRRYSSSVAQVDLFNTIMDDYTASIIVDGVCKCTNLTFLHLGTANSSPSFATVIERNKNSLCNLIVPADDDDMPLIAHTSRNALV